VTEWILSNDGDGAASSNDLATLRVSLHNVIDMSQLIVGLLIIVNSVDEDIDVRALERIASAGIRREVS